ncbi:linear amide C-N hydrolase [bacterium]|nr:linear amide C-N hydrolase [bacterium]RQV92098.1 MAG: linear amide C-N hydrolase [bacterium]
MKKILLTITALIISYNPIFSCTIFNATHDDITLIGNNEDWTIQEAYIKCAPREDNQYGRITFGFGDDCQYPFGGINDQGLFYEIASLTRRNDIRFDPNKETIDNPIYEKVLETCASIEEAIDLIKQYNVTGFMRHHIMVVDRSGASATIEWGRDSLSVIRKNNHYQVMTNFNNTDPSLAGGYPCFRYMNAERKLDNLEDITVEDFRLILQSVHNSGPDYPTIYSNIYDLKNRLIYVYYLHNFEEYTIIDIEDELKKEEHTHYLPSLFSYLKLHEPAMDASVSYTSVELVWEGNADRYHVYCSQNPDFENCQPLEINEPLSAGDEEETVFACIMWIPFLAIVYWKRKGIPAIAATVLSGSLLFSCSPRIRMPETTEHSYVLSGLEQNTTYYWKIVAHQNMNHSSTSIIKTFQTDH